MIWGVTADSVPTSPIHRHSEVLETEVLEKKFLFILTLNWPRSTMKVFLNNSQEDLNFQSQPLCNELERALVS